MDWKRYQRVIDSMKDEGIGQLIVTDSVSVYYLTGKLINCMERMMALYLDVEKEKPLLDLYAKNLKKFYFRGARRAPLQTP